MSLTFFSFGVPVDIRVIDQKRDRSDWSIKMPVYEILSGTHEGIQKTSTIGTSFGTHRAGKDIKGLYLKRLGFIESIASLKLTAAMGNVIIAGVIAFSYL